MSYLLPAGTAPRTKNKWGLGAVPMRTAVAAAPKSQAIAIRSPIYDNGGPVLPGPMPIFRGPISVLNPPNPLPGATLPPATAGTPVPSGFPTNQFFVAPDGSVWEYSTSSNSWFNTGTPYQQPGTSTTPAATSPVPAGWPTSAAYTDGVGNIWTWNGTAWVVSGSVSSGGLLTSSSPAAPVSVTVTSPSTTDTGYQAVLDWLTQQTLISSLPNWMVLAGGALAYKMFFASSGKGR